MTVLGNTVLIWLPYFRLSGSKNQTAESSWTWFSRQKRFAGFSRNDCNRRNSVRLRSLSLIRYSAAFAACDSGGTSRVEALHRNLWWALCGYPLDRALLSALHRNLL